MRITRGGGLYRAGTTPIFQDMTINVVGVEELTQVIEDTVKATVAEVLRKMKEGEYYEPQDIMTTDELLEYFNRHGVKISKQTIFTYTCKGTIPFFKVAQSLRFKREEIDQWLDEYCNRGRKKGDKSAAVEALAESAAEITKRNK